MTSFNHSRKTSLLTCLGVSLFAGFASLAQAALIVDRGLPDQNLNNAAGADRSNVAWGFGGSFLAGDDFSLGAVAPGNRSWRIDRIRVWQIGGVRPWGTNSTRYPCSWAATTAAASTR